jgi:hypothetical protein
MFNYVHAQFKGYSKGLNSLHLLLNQFFLDYKTNISKENNWFEYKYFVSNYILFFEVALILMLPSLSYDHIYAEPCV